MYISLIGIPYAEKPTGELRFKVSIFISYEPRSEKLKKKSLN
ncbi:hypothetical protein EON73_05510 [bacterium]|nr:MAG: hypothetical protein EON73_05510 [bacterium]